MSSVIQTYVEEIFDVRTGRWLAAGAGCLVFYDWLICLDDEYKYIWKSRRSLGKCLYFFHRYPLIAASVVALAFDSSTGVPASACKYYVPTDYSIDLIVVLSVQLTLLLRVNSLYGNNQTLFLSLCVLFMICMAATWALYAKSITRFFYYPTPFPLTGCLPDCHDCYALIPLIHVPIVVFDTVVVILTLRKCLKFFKKGRFAMPALNSVFRDGCAYYLVTFVCVVLNVTWLSLAPSAKSTWFLPWMRSIVGIMGTRLLLNLRGHIEEPRQPDTELFQHTVNLPIPDSIHLDAIQRTLPRSRDPFTQMPKEEALGAWSVAKTPDPDDSDLTHDPWSPSSLGSSVPIIGGRRSRDFNIVAASNDGHYLVPFG